jgi:hypothetical protein
MEDNYMNTIEDEDDLSTDDKLDAQRDVIRQSIDATANDIGTAMRDVGLSFPIYIIVRNSGDALATIATSSDPSDADWQQASVIVCRTFEERVGCDRLRGRELACAIANAGDKCNRRDGRLIHRTATRDGFARLLAFLQPDGVLIVTIFRCSRQSVRRIRSHDQTDPT